MGNKPQGNPCVISPFFHEGATVYEHIHTGYSRIIAVASTTEDARRICAALDWVENVSIERSAR